MAAFCVTVGELNASSHRFAASFASAQCDDKVISSWQLLAKHAEGICLPCPGIHRSLYVCGGSYHISC